MDSRIPKPSGLKKPFDFTAFKNKTSDPDEIQKKPLSEINNKSFGAFQRARSPDFRSQPVEEAPKLRRSKSAAELRSQPLRGGVKRPFKPTLETIPIKRLKTGLVGGSHAMKTAPLPIRTQEKKTAIMNSLKSSSVVTLTSKKPLAKLLSQPITKSVAKPVSSKPTNAPASKPAMKPAPYDFKARFNLLSETHKSLKEKFSVQKEQMQVLEETNDAAEQREKDLRDKLEAIEQELSEANKEKLNLVKEIEELKGINSDLVTKNKALADSLAQSAEELTELKVRQVKLEETAKAHENLLEVADGLRKDLGETKAKLLASQDQLYVINHERMVLHNQVLDLRGNIRVFARVRPPISGEMEKVLCGWSFIDETALEINSNELVPAGRKPAKHEFSFDQVFDPNTSQEEIFEMVSPLIQSAMDGYNVCIFAYGQTGSGKTFTMDGAGESHLGIIPRTVQLLFSAMQTASVLGWTYTVTASFLEIYNEVLYDLLSNDDKEIEIRMLNSKSKTEIYVSNITLKEVKSAAALYELMRIARSNRATAATAGNERSSRSHAVTRLEIVGEHSSRPEKLVGFINLVDLAGSESPKTSQRMDETKSINKSLSELSNVILALVQKNDHIPFRNSKLTHLLMPCLGGNSKTLMFVNVSPFQENFGESVKSLRFAAQVNTCKMAKPKRNRQYNVGNTN